ncbi:FAS1 domain-containing protein [Zychaea mexicana]|uniref:FAS1 domain-containing protein n=1 Tax=Zychaea mexicana TaxID=64656 RepID=UPI0022FEC6DA|nr:FAS1 domain-containing protein [Zychaea mexicana]KAI9492063.1 FAS1 domain-containing protein [Zychaea mexicana]
MHLRLLLINLVFLWSTLTAAYAKTVVETLTSDDRFREFVRQLKRTDLLQDLGHYDTATVFAPTNEAFNLAIQGMTRAELLYHILPQSVYTSEWHGGELLDTCYTQDGRVQKIKMTKNGKHWSPAVNVDIIDADVKADNGVVQVVNGLLTPPKDLGLTLAEHEELHPFSDLAKKADIETELKRANGYTIFATQDVLDGLTDAEKAYLNHSGAKDDLGQVLHHQISDKILYFGEFPTGKTQLETLQGEKLELVLDKNNEATVNGAKIVQSDILASNGVIHLLEKSILPNNRDFLKLNVRKALIGLNATKFVTLLEDNGLKGYLDTKDPYTLVAPPNEELDERNIPRSEIQSWLKYHIIDKKYELDNFTDGDLLKTESGDHLGGDKQRLRVHSVDQDQMPVNAKKKSVQFDRANLIGNPVTVDNSIIYPVSRSLELPRDPLSQLPLNLDLSTFVASLYASGAAGEIKSAEGITVFAPTNKAFARLGILTKHLLQPSSQDKLASVIKFHAVKHGIYYFNETKQGEYRVPTLSGPEINLNKTHDGHLYVRGVGAGDGSDRSVIAKVVQPDMLVSNGVIHKIDRVEIPATLKVSNCDLLLAENTNSFVNLISKTDLANQILDSPDQPYTVLAPSDRAFARLNVSDLLNHPDQLLRIAKLHVLPVALPKMTLQPGQSGERLGKQKDMYDDDDDDDCRNTHSDINGDGVEFSPLLEDEKIIITQVDAGYTIQVKGDTTHSADVVQIGRASNAGGVVEIDRVLLPRDQLGDGGGGLAWWAVLLIVIGVLLGAALLAAVAYYGWRWWKQRREGYISLDRDN